MTTYDRMPIVGLDADLRISAAASTDEQGLTLRQFVGLLDEMMARPEYRDRSQ